MLPKLPNADKIKKAQTVQFSGINRNPAAIDGTVFYTTNMGADRMPLLSPRKRRYTIGQYSNCYGMYAYNGLWMVRGNSVFKDGLKVAYSVNTKPKTFAAMNDQLIMFPDKLLIDATDNTKADWNTGSEIKNAHGYFEVIRRKLNTSEDPDEYTEYTSFVSDNIDFLKTAVRYGQLVTITGSTVGSNNTTIRVRRVEENRLVFDPYVLEPVEDQTINLVVLENGDATVSFVKCSFSVKSETYLTNVNCIASDDVDFRLLPFKVGDTIDIEGSTVPENNKSATVTQVTERLLVFGVDEFTRADNQTLTLSKPPVQPEGNTHLMTLTFSQADVAFIDHMDGQTVLDQANTIRSTNIYWSNTKLKVGDAITITGSEKNDGTYVIRGIDGADLFFDENVFTLWPEQEQGQPLATEQVKITREVPDMDGIFVHENRLWGYKDNTIYASKLGDPTNFNVYDLLADDSWTWTMDGSGHIIGAIVYQGYPMFFKEDKVVRIYGDRPSQFRAMDVTTMGIHPGCGKSLAIAGDTLYYVSRNGLTAYSGGYGQNVHDPFGELNFTRAVAGSDGQRYFLSAFDGERWHLFVYDSVWNAWFQEDNKEVTQFACDVGNMYMMANYYDSSFLFLDGHSVDVPAYANEEGPVESEVIFNDFTGNYWTAGRGYGNPSRKGTSKLQFRVTLEQDAELEAWMVFDDETTVFVSKMQADHKKSFYLPIIPRRSDHYKIILRGKGDWTLNSLVREEYSGSDIH